MHRFCRMPRTVGVGACVASDAIGSDCRMSRARSSQQPSPRNARWIRAAIGAAVVLVVVLVPVVLFADDDGSPSHHEPPVVKGDALAAVRAALGQTASAGN